MNSGSPTHMFTKEDDGIHLKYLGDWHQKDISKKLKKYSMLKQSMNLKAK